MPISTRTSSYIFLLLLLQPFLHPSLFADEASHSKVVFINPGHAHESFWQDVDLFMLEAARQLNITINIKHAERNHLKMIQFAKEIGASKDKPDYLILVNEKQAAEGMLSQLEDSGIKVLLLLNDLSADQKEQLLSTPYWKTHFLGSLVPDNHYIGFATARSLFTSSTQPDNNNILIISGDKSTPASRQREAGVRDYIDSNPELNLLQTIYGHWQESRTEKQMDILLKRYPNLKLIWTANDLMAFGALSSAKKTGKTPGKDIFISSVNTSKKVLRLRENNSISVLGGGHFSAGGWALVLIKDHLNGFSLPNMASYRFFQLIEPNTKAFQLLQDKRWQDLDFKKHSKSFNPDLTQYQFAIN